jgi:ferric iron reductase protein FhuF
MTIAALAPLFVGDFEHYRHVMVLPDDQRPGIPASELITHDGLERLLARYRRHQPGEDRRALVSQWSRFYFVKLIVPTVAANLVLGHELPVSVDRLEVILGDDGLPEAFRLPHEGKPFTCQPEGPFERFEALLEGNLAPVVEGWNQQVRLSRKVLWNNAANYLEWLIGAMAGLGVPAAMLADGNRLIEWEHRPDGRRNPMYRPVCYVKRATGPSLLRQRRQCCIRYRLPDLALCENCPHIDRPPKGARLPESLIQRC